MNVLVQAILPSVLGGYCEPESFKGLSASWKGDTIEAKGIILKQSVLDAAGLSSFKLRLGSVGLLRISIPGGILGLRRLYSEPVKVLVQDVHVLLERQGMPSVADAQAAQFAQRMKELETDTDLYRQRLIEVLEPLVTAQLGSALASAAGSGGGGGTISAGGFVEAIVKNGQVELNGVHIRYEDATTCPSMPFAVGVTLNSFVTAGGLQDVLTSSSAPAAPDTSVGTHGAPSSADAPTAAMLSVQTASQPFPVLEGLQYRSARLDGLSMYWDPLFVASSAGQRHTGAADSALFQSLVSMDASRRAELMRAGVASSSADDARHQYLLSPSSPSMSLALNPGIRVAGQPFIRASLSLDAVGLGISKDQFSAATLLSRFMAEHARVQEQARLKPTVRPTDGKEAVHKWWKYIFMQLRGGSKASTSAARWDASRARGAMAKRRIYIDAYRKLIEADGAAMKKVLEASLKGGTAAAPPSADSLKGALDKVVAERLKSLESELTHEQVIEFRAVARAQYETDVEAQTQKAVDKAADKASAAAAGGNKGWLGWVWSGSNAASEAERSDTTGSSSAAGATARTTAVVDADRVQKLAAASRAAISSAPMYTLTAKLSSARFAMSSVYGRNIAVGTLSAQAGLYTTNGRNWSAAVCISDLAVQDMVTKDTAWPFILSKRGGSGAPSVLPFVAAELEAHPLDNPDLDMRIRLDTTPLQVVAPFELVRALASFVDIPAVADVAAGASEAAANMQAAIVADTYSALAAAPRLDVVARISAPWLLLPTNIRNAGCAQLTVRLGDLHVCSSSAEAEIANRSAAIVDSTQMPASEKTIAVERLGNTLIKARDYQTWRFQLSHMGALMAPAVIPGKSLELAAQDVIEPISLDMAVQTCIQPAARVKNRLRVYAVLPKVSASLSVALVQHLAVLQAQATELSRLMLQDSLDNAANAAQMVPISPQRGAADASGQSLRSPARRGSSSVPAVAHKETQSKKASGQQTKGLSGEGTKQGKRRPSASVGSSSGSSDDSEGLVLDFSVGLVQLQLSDVCKASKRMVQLIRAGQQQDLTREPPLAGPSSSDLTISLQGIAVRASLGVATTIASFAMRSLEIVDHVQTAGDAFATFLSSAYMPEAAAPILLPAAENLSARSKGGDGSQLIHIGVTVRQPPRNRAPTKPKMEADVRFAALYVGYNPGTVAALQLYAAYMAALLAGPTGAATATTSVSSDPSFVGQQSGLLPASAPAGLDSVLDNLFATVDADSGSDDALLDGSSAGSDHSAMQQIASSSSAGPVPHMQVSVHLAGVSLSMNRETERRSVALGVLANVSVGYADYGSVHGSKVNVSVSDVALLDVSTHGTQYPALLARQSPTAAKAVHHGQDTKLLSLTFSSYAPGHPSGFDSLLQAQLTAPTIVYIARVWDDILDYLITGLLGTALTSASELAGQAITAAAKSKLGLQVSISGGESSISLPVHARSQRCLQLQIGSITISNAFKQDTEDISQWHVASVPTLDQDGVLDRTVDDLTIALEGLHISTLRNKVCSPISDADENKAGLSLSLRIVRPFSDSYAAHVPGLRVRIHAPHLHLALHRDQYALLMDAIALNIGGPSEHQTVVSTLGRVEGGEDSSSPISAVEALSAAVPVAATVPPKQSAQHNAGVPASSPSTVPALDVMVSVPGDVALVLRGSTRGGSVVSSTPGMELLRFALVDLHVRYSSFTDERSNLALSIQRVLAEDMSSHSRSALLAPWDSSASSVATLAQVRLGLSMSAAAMDVDVILAGTTVQVLPASIERILWYVSAPTMRVPEGFGAEQSSSAASHAEPQAQATADSMVEKATVSKTSFSLTVSGTQFLLPVAAVQTAGAVDEALSSVHLSFSGGIQYSAMSDGSRMEVQAELKALKAHFADKEIIEPTGITASYSQEQQSATLLKRRANVQAGSLRLSASYPAVAALLSFNDTLQDSGLLAPALEAGMPAEDVHLLLGSAQDPGANASPPPPISGGPSHMSNESLAPVLQTDDNFDLSWEGLQVAVMDDAPASSSMIGSPMKQQQVTSSALLDGRMQAVSVSLEGHNGQYFATANLQLIAHVGGKGRPSRPLVHQPWKFAAGFRQSLATCSYEFGQTQGTHSQSAFAAPLASHITVSATNALAVLLQDTDLACLLSGVSKWTTSLTALSLRTGSGNAEGAADAPTLANKLPLASTPILTLAGACRYTTISVKVKIPTVSADLVFASGRRSSLPGQGTGAGTVHEGKHLVRLYAVDLGFGMTSYSVIGFDKDTKTTASMIDGSDMHIRMAGLHVLDIANSELHQAAFGILVTSFSTEDKCAQLRQLCIQLAEGNKSSVPDEEGMLEDGDKALLDVRIGSVSVNARATEGVPTAILTEMRTACKVHKVDSAIVVDADSLSVGWNSASMHKLLVWLLCATSTDEEPDVSNHRQVTAAPDAAHAAGSGAIAQPTRRSSSTLHVHVRSLSFTMNKELAARRVCRALVSGVSLSMHTPEAQDAPSQLDLALQHVELADMTAIPGYAWNAQGLPVLSSSPLPSSGGESTPFVSLRMQSGLPLQPNAAAVGSQLSIDVQPLQLVYHKPLIDEILAYLFDDLLPVLSTSDPDTTTVAAPSSEAALSHTAWKRSSEPEVRAAAMDMSIRVGQSRVIVPASSYASVATGKAGLRQADTASLTLEFSRLQLSSQLKDASVPLSIDDAKAADLGAAATCLSILIDDLTLSSCSRTRMRSVGTPSASEDEGIPTTLPIITQTVQLMLTKTDHVDEQLSAMTGSLLHIPLPALSLCVDQARLRALRRVLNNNILAALPDIATPKATCLRSEAFVPVPSKQMDKGASRCSRKHCERGIPVASMRAYCNACGRTVCLSCVAGTVWDEEAGQAKTLCIACLARMERHRVNEEGGSVMSGSTDTPRVPHAGSNRSEGGGSEGRQTGDTASTSLGSAVRSKAPAPNIRPMAIQVELPILQLALASTAHETADSQASRSADAFLQLSIVMGTYTLKMGPEPSMLLSPSSSSTSGGAGGRAKDKEWDSRHILEVGAIQVRQIAPLPSFAGSATECRVPLGGLATIIGPNVPALQATARASALRHATDSPVDSETGQASVPVSITPQLFLSMSSRAYGNKSKIRAGVYYTDIHPHLPAILAALQVLAAYSETDTPVPTITEGVDSEMAVRSRSGSVASSHDRAPGGSSVPYLGHVTVRTANPASTMDISLSLGHTRIVIPRNAAVARCQAVLISVPQAAVSGKMKMSDVRPVVFCGINDRLVGRHVVATRNARPVEGYGAYSPGLLARGRIQDSVSSWSIDRMEVRVALLRVSSAGPLPAMLASMTEREHTWAVSEAATAELVQLFASNMSSLPTLHQQILGRNSDALVSAMESLPSSAHSLSLQLAVPTRTLLSQLVFGLEYGSSCTSVIGADLSSVVDPSGRLSLKRSERGIAWGHLPPIDPSAVIAVGRPPPPTTSLALNIESKVEARLTLGDALSASDVITDFLSGMSASTGSTHAEGQGMHEGKGNSVAAPEPDIDAGMHLEESDLFVRRESILPIDDGDTMSSQFLAWHALDYEVVFPMTTESGKGKQPLSLGLGVEVRRFAGDDRGGKAGIPFVLVTDVRESTPASAQNAAGSSDPTALSPPSLMYDDGDGIIQARDGTPAARVGKGYLCTGDVLLGMNGREVEATSLRTVLDSLRGARGVKVARMRRMPLQVRVSAAEGFRVSILRGIAGSTTGAPTTGPSAGGGEVSAHASIYNLALYLSSGTADPKDPAGIRLSPTVDIDLTRLKRDIARRAAGESVLAVASPGRGLPSQAHLAAGSTALQPPVSLRCVKDLVALHELAVRDGYRRPADACVLSSFTASAAVDVYNPQSRAVEPLVEPWEVSASVAKLDVFTPDAEAARRMSMGLDQADKGIATSARTVGESTPDAGTTGLYPTMHLALSTSSLELVATPGLFSAVQSLGSEFDEASRAAELETESVRAQAKSGDAPGTAFTTSASTSILRGLPPRAFPIIVRNETGARVAIAVHIPGLRSVADADASNSGDVTTSQPSYGAVETRAVSEGDTQDADVHPEAKWASACDASAVEAGERSFQSSALEVGGVLLGLRQVVGLSLPEHAASGRGARNTVASLGASVLDHAQLMVLVHPGVSSAAVPQVEDHPVWVAAPLNHMRAGVVRVDTPCPVIEARTGARVPVPLFVHTKHVDGKTVITLRSSCVVENHTGVAMRIHALASDGASQSLGVCPRRSSFPVPLSASTFVRLAFEPIAPSLGSGVRYGLCTPALAVGKECWGEATSSVTNAAAGTEQALLLPLHFMYKSRVARDVRGSPAYCSIVVSPPIILTNALPIRLAYRLDSGKHSVTASLLPGEKAEIMQVSGLESGQGSSAGPSLALRPADDVLGRWSSSTVVALGAGEDHVLRELVMPRADRNVAPLTVQLEISSRGRAAVPHVSSAGDFPGTLRITAFAPCWVVNATGLPLAVGHITSDGGDAGDGNGINVLPCSMSGGRLPVVEEVWEHERFHLVAWGDPLPHERHRWSTATGVTKDQPYYANVKGPPEGWEWVSHFSGSPTGWTCGDWEYEMHGFHAFERHSTPQLEFRPGHIVRRRRYTRVRAYTGRRNGNTGSLASGSASPGLSQQHEPGTAFGTVLSPVPISHSMAVWRMHPSYTSPATPAEQLAGALLAAEPSVPGTCVIPCSPPDGAVQVCVPGGRWSPPIAFQQDKNAYETLLIRGPNESGTCKALPGADSSLGTGDSTWGYEVVVERSACPSPFHGTRVLKIYPRVTVVNASHEPLAIRQAGRPHQRPLLLGSSHESYPELQLSPFSACPVWWSSLPDNDDKKRIQISPARPDGTATGMTSSSRDMLYTRGGWSAPLPVLCPSSGSVCTAAVSVVCPPIPSKGGSHLPAFVRADLGLAAVGTNVLSVTLRPHPSIPSGSLLVVGRCTHPSLPLRPPSQTVLTDSVTPFEVLAAGNAAALDAHYIDAARQGLCVEKSLVLSRPPIAFVNHSGFTVAVMQGRPTVYASNGRQMSQDEVAQATAQLKSFKAAGASAALPAFDDLGVWASSSVTYVTPGSVLPYGLADAGPALAGQGIELWIRAIAVHASEATGASGHANAVDAGPGVCLDLSVLEIPKRVPVSAHHSQDGRPPPAVAAVVRMGLGGAREIVITDAQHPSAAFTAGTRGKARRESADSWSAALDSRVGGGPAPGVLSQFLDRTPGEASSLADALEFGNGSGPVEMYLSTLYSLCNGHVPRAEDAGAPQGVHGGAPSAQAGSAVPATSISSAFPVRVWESVARFRIEGVGLSVIGPSGLTARAPGASSPGGLARPGTEAELASHTELMYLSLRALAANMLVSHGALKADVNVGSLQIDDQDVSTPSPVVLAIAGSPAVKFELQMSSRQSVTGAQIGVLGVLTDPAGALAGAHVQKVMLGMPGIRLRLTFELAARVLRLLTVLGEQSSSLSQTMQLPDSTVVVPSALDHFGVPAAVARADQEGSPDQGSAALNGLLACTAFSLSPPASARSAQSATDAASVATDLLGSHSTSSQSLMTAPFFANEAQIRAVRIAIDYARIRSDEGDDAVVRSFLETLAVPAAGLVVNIASTLTLTGALLTAGDSHNGLAHVQQSVTTVGALTQTAINSAMAMQSQAMALLGNVIGADVMSAGKQIKSAVQRGDVVGVASGAVGVVTGAAGAGLGLLSALSGVVSKTASDIAGDSEKIMGPTEAKKDSKPQLAGVAMGVGKGAATAVAGVFGGAIGLFTETAKGMSEAATAASKGDAQGFFTSFGTGLAKGVTGAVAKPLAGLAGGASHVFQGAASTVAAVQKGADKTLNSVAETVTSIPQSLLSPGRPSAASGSSNVSGSGGGGMSSADLLDAPSQRVRAPRPIFGSRGAVTTFDTDQAELVSNIRSRALRAASSSGGLADAALAAAAAESVYVAAHLPDISSDGADNPFQALVATSGRIILMDRENKPAVLLPMQAVESARVGATGDTVVLRTVRGGKREQWTLPVDLNAEDPLQLAESICRGIEDAIQSGKTSSA